MKLDAKFYGVIVKAKNNTIVPDDEYVVFLAKDNAFFETLPTYLEKCVALGAQAEQVDAVRNMITRVAEWRYRNQHRLKVPDAKGEKMLA